MLLVVHTHVVILLMCLDITFKVPPLVMKKNWFLVDPQQIKNRDYMKSVSHPTKSARLAFFAEFGSDLSQVRKMCVV